MKNTMFICLLMLATGCWQTGGLKTTINHPVNSASGLAHSTHAASIQTLRAGGKFAEDLGSKSLESQIDELYWKFQTTKREELAPLFRVNRILSLPYLQ